jgi:YD repeat-containing protein
VSADHREYKASVTIAPDTLGGERGWWTASVSRHGHENAPDYDGQGRTVEEALCDLVDVLYVALQGDVS